MKTFLIFLLVLTASHCSGPKGTNAVPTDTLLTSETGKGTDKASLNTSLVYICDGKGAKKYHYSEHCRGLSNCSHQIIRLTVTEARKKGKTPCKWEQ